MPREAKYKLPDLNIKGSLGQRIAMLRKERGYTQFELASKIGINRVLISDYERDKIRPHYEIIIHLAIALEVTTDELLGLKTLKGRNDKISLKILRRMKKIEALSDSHQKFILKTIDSHLKALGH
jgi:transcriptional regulator with XRE-family HTH domain